MPVDAGAIIESLWAWVAGFCLAAGALGCVYVWLTSLLVLRYGRPASHRPSAPPSPPPATILKPLCGAEPGLAPRLAAYCRQDYPGPVQVVFGVQDPEDPAIGAVREVQAACPEADVSLVVSDRPHGSNRKVSNLINMIGAARHDVLVVVDSDVEVGPDYLGEIVTELERPGTGVVTCLYHGAPGDGFWARLAALGTDTHFLPDVVAGLTLGLARPCFGATIALRREMLERIGGLEAFADCLADDHAIGKAVRSAGGRVGVPRFTVGHGCYQHDARSLLGQEMRYARTIRGIDPAGHAGSVVTHPFALALFPALLGSDWTVHAAGLAIAALALSGRLALTLAVERRFGLARHSYWMLPLRDLISFGVYVGSLAGGTVSWRGFRYRAMSDGTLVQHPN